VEQSLVEQVAQLTQAHERTPFELLEGQTHVAVRGDELACPSLRVPCELEVGKQPAELREVDAVRALVRLGARGHLDLAACLGAEEPGELANAVVLLRRADVHGLATDHVLRRLEDGARNGCDVADVNEWPPGRAVAQQSDVTRRMSPRG